MFSLYGKESISIMFAVFSVGVTLFASSSSFPFVNEDDTSQMNKLNFLINFDNSTVTVKEREKFILYNAELAHDNKKLTGHGTNFDYAESERIYNETKEYTILEKASLDLAIIPVYYNEGKYDDAEKKLERIEMPHPNFQNESIPISEVDITIRSLLETELSSKNSTVVNFSTEEEIMMKYWYASYVLAGSGEFPGCATDIFNNKNIDRIEIMIKEKRDTEKLESFLKKENTTKKKEEKLESFLKDEEIEIEKLESFLKDKENLEIEELKKVIKDEEIEIEKLESFLKDKENLEIEELKKVIKDEEIEIEELKKILKKTKPKCTHNELRFIDKMIDDLNYESYRFDIGNKHQSTEKIFYQDEIKKFFEDYMNWLIIGVALIVLVGWTTITKPQDKEEI